MPTGTGSADSDPIRIHPRLPCQPQQRRIAVFERRRIRVLGSQPVFYRRQRNAGEMGQLAAVLVVLDSGTHQRAAAVDPQQRGCPVGKAGWTMQANRDVFVDRDDRYVADPAGVAHQLHDCALEFVTVVQSVSAGQEARHFAQRGIQSLS
jgi:hypothetical protein